MYLSVRIVYVDSDYYFAALPYLVILWRGRYTGVRSGIEMDAALLRMSQRPPPRFSVGTDLILWLSRFELYVRLAKIPKEQVTGELLSLLDDEPFRVISQQGLVDSPSYDSVVKCLRALYAPEGNQLEWQRKLQSRMQKTGEQLVEFAGELRVLADRAYPKWSSENKQEVLRDQFMQGVRSSSVQLRLMKEMPPTLEDALKLASQLEAVEEAQKRLQKDRCQAESLALTEDAEDDGSCTSNAASDYRRTGSTQEKESLEKRLGWQLKQTEEMVHQLSTQVQQLLKESARGTSRSRWPARRKDGGTGQKQASGPICWECGKQGHIKRDCPQRRTAFKAHFPSESAAVSAALFIYGYLEGRPTKILVDTGSAVTIIRRDIWDEIGQKQLETPLRAVFAANGDEINLSGQGDVCIRVGDLSVKHNVLVAECLTQDCLLGSDFLVSYGCVIDLHNHSLLVKGTAVPLSSGNHSSVTNACGVSVAETVEVPANCQMRLMANRQDKRQGQHVSDLVGVMFEPSQDFMECHGLAVAHAVVQESNGGIVVQVLNPTPHAVQVRQGRRIGCLRPLMDICAIELEATQHRNDRKSALEATIHQLVSSAQDVTQRERQQLADLLAEFESIISVRDDDLGRTDLVYHRIDTGDAVPIRQPVRRLPYFQREEVRKMIAEMLSKGIIEPSTSAWSSPVVLVKKRDGNTRFCIDFRKVNAVTIKDAQPLPRIDDTLDSLGDASYLSTLDLASGYWQVEVDPSDREKTAFVTPFGLHQFRVMPFGLCNAPATFQRLMEQVLTGLHWSTCLVYLDDIIVFSRTVAEHLGQLRAKTIQMPPASEQGLLFGACSVGKGD